LWIELLKNAYYKNETELETLPNIDINIKCGNSLISRFAIDADLGQALKKSKWTIDSYRLAVSTYRNAQNKEQKREMERLIADIKSDFRSEISSNDPKLKRLQKIKGELFTLTNQTTLFEKSKKEKEVWNKKVQKFSDEIKNLETEIEEIKNNKIFENAFEWRFEFPEVLNERGDFIGFDVVIGNPPYISTKEISVNQKAQYLLSYKVAVGQFDLYLIFTELAFNILKTKGYFSFITSNTYISNKDCQKFREFIASNTSILEIINLDESIFTDAHLDVGILSYKKELPQEDYSFKIAKDKFDFLNNIRTYYLNNRILNSDTSELKIGFTDEDWLLFDKINSNPKLKEFVNVTRGIEFGGNSDNIYEEPFEDSYPIIVGSSISKYRIKEIKGYATHNSSDLSVYKPIEIYTQPRILIQRIRNLTLKDRIVATYTENKILSTNTLRILISLNNTISLKYILGVLNSRLINYFFSKNFNNKDIYAYQLAEIPINYNQDYVSIIESITGEILDIKQNDIEASTLGLENKLNHIVYELYNLSSKEIEIVENSLK